MGIWKAWLGDAKGNEWPLGWNSPIRGPVHPKFVPIAEPSGLGWLDGFDELLCRCGLFSNGAPDFDERGVLLHPLHGRIANRPAHRLSVETDFGRRRNSRCRRRGRMPVSLSKAAADIDRATASRRSRESKSWTR